VHLVEARVQLLQVLLVHEVLDQFVTRHVLAVDEILHQPVPGEQFLHLGEVGLQFFRVGVAQFLVHAAPPSRLTMTTFIATPVRAHRRTARTGLRGRLRAAAGCIEEWSLREIGNREFPRVRTILPI
jgi:hypothetical protein